MGLIRPDTAAWTARVNAELGSEYLVAAPVAPYRQTQFGDSALGELVDAVFEVFLFVARTATLLISALVVLVRARSVPKTHRGAKVLAISEHELALLAVDGLPFKRKIRVQSSRPRSEAGLLMRAEPHGRHYQL